MAGKHFISLSSPEVIQRLSRQFRSHDGKPHFWLIEPEAPIHRGRCILCGVYEVWDPEARKRQPVFKCVKLSVKGQKREQFFDVAPATTRRHVNTVRLLSQSTAQKLSHLDV